MAIGVAPTGRSGVSRPTLAAFFNKRPKMKAKMKKLVLVTVVVAAAAGGLSALNRLAADDQSPISASGQRVRIIGGPELEKASDNWAIIRWTTNNVRRT